jgi:protein-S-isoprenylcysteine O-methyltransferase
LLNISEAFLFGTPYCIAMSLAIVEFVIEVNYFPNVKQYPYIYYIGIVLVVIGEFIRKAAMLTAKSSFTHLIKHHKREEHVLVTHGIYNYIRYFCLRI